MNKREREARDLRLGICREYPANRWDERPPPAMSHALLWLSYWRLKRQRGRLIREGVPPEQLRNPIRPRRAAKPEWTEFGRKGEQ